MEIVWKGNQHTNSSSRQGHVPFVIVNHVSAGTMESMDNWFTSPDNDVSSAHFGVAKDGRIHQYVEIERMAWAQGITAEMIPKAPAQVVRDMGVNPNLYCVAIEHEGHDGHLTQEQFAASVWLHRYIQTYIQDKWNKSFALDAYHVIGHYQINPVSKPNCPGPNFPWDNLYAALAETEQEGDEDMEELKQRLEALEQRVVELEKLTHMPVPDWARDSVDKAVDQGLVDSPEQGSYDFYRFLTILDRKALL